MTCPFMAGIADADRFACVGGLLWGYDAQIGGGTLSIPAFRRDFGTPFRDDWVIPARWQSAFSSASSIGGLFGGLSVGIIADKVGYVWHPSPR